MNPRPSVLLIAYRCDALDVSESWAAHRWALGLAPHVDLTVLTTHRAGHPSPASQLPGVRVIEWVEGRRPARLERLDSMLKPGYGAFARKARRWIRAALARGERFDVAHQVSPLALRYRCPATGLGIPVVLGPVGGSLSTPAAFASEVRAPWFTRLRALDGLRLRLSPSLRRSYEEAELVVGVAPYVRDVLGSLELRRFEVQAETGFDLLPARPAGSRREGPTRFLFVGRVIRTKGVRDAIRAFARLPEAADCTLDVVGDGNDLEACRAEAERLGAASRIRFRGRLPRALVDGFYRDADVFLFPSWREPSGTVVFEALAHGLPVVCADRGGPGHVIDGSCGVKVPVDTPDAFAMGLARAVQSLAAAPARRRALAEGARHRAVAVGSWERKITWMLARYGEAIATAKARGTGEAARAVA